MTYRFKVEIEDHDIMCVGRDTSTNETGTSTDETGSILHSRCACFCPRCYDPNREDGFNGSHCICPECACRKYDPYDPLKGE